LINTVLANIVVEQIVSCRDRGFYKLHASVLGPGHLHVLLKLRETTTVEKAMQMIEAGSARGMGQESPQKFPIWHAGFHDRWMRDAEEYRESKRQIEQYPVEAKLVERPEDSVFSSASGKFAPNFSRFDEFSG
jgi:REP-associated tyrosine transposase